MGETWIPVPPPSAGARHFELKRANEILEEGGGRVSPKRSSTAERSNLRLIDQRREISGVEPICAVLPIAPSPYFLHKEPLGWFNVLVNEDKHRMLLTTIASVRTKSMWAVAGAAQGRPH